MLRMCRCGITISLLDTMKDCVPLLKSLCISKKVVILKNMMIMPMRCDFTSLECHVLRYRY